MGRLEKYKAKLDPEVIGKRYDATKELAVRKQTSYFKDAAELEAKVKIACDGAPSISHHFYIAFAEEMAKTPTSAERSIIFTKWAMRGLSWFYLLQVAMKIFGDVPELAGVGVLPPTLGYWSFHANAGLTAFDFSGNNHPGTILGATWTTGKVGNCLDYDGLNDYIQVLPTTLFNVRLNEAITISVWIKGKPQATNQSILWNEGLCIGWYLRLENTGNIRFNLATGDNDCVGPVAYSVIASDRDYDDENWYNIVGVIDRPNQIMRLYINGEFKGETVIDNLTKSAGTNSRIGTIWNLTEWFKGKIDEVIIYPRALTAEEIRTYYLATN